jgi:hypothetical protein
VRDRRRLFDGHIKINNSKPVRRLVNYRQYLFGFACRMTQIPFIHLKILFSAQMRRHVFVSLSVMTETFILGISIVYERIVQMEQKRCQDSVDR